MISKEKIALLHVGKAKLGWSDGVYREALRFHGGVKSSKDLDEDGFKKVIDHMKALGFWVERKWEQTKPRDPGDLPTPDQLKVIAHLWEDLSQYISGATHAAFRRGFYEKRLRIPALGPQTRAQANVCIEALKNRVYSEMKKAVADGRSPFGLGAKEPA